MSSPIDFEQAVMARHVANAQHMFQRVLVCWAGDVLELRRRDLLVPRWASTPSSSDCQADQGNEPMRDVA
jgi:hypothetical protein